MTLTIWDSDGLPPADAADAADGGVVYTWNGFDEDGSVHSILRYAEEHAERLRAKYLAWIHDLGESRIDGVRLIDHLSLGNGLSYWWMTPIFEKCVYASSSISDAIRLCALEEIIEEHHPDRVRLVSANRTLHRVTRGLCHSVGISYRWEQSAGEPMGFSLRYLYRMLPHPIQALIFLARHLGVHWALRQAERSGWRDGDQSLFFCSYFANLDRTAAESGRFVSHYWKELPELLRRRGVVGNWLQLYVPCADVPNAKAASSWVRRFNVARGEQGFHTFLGAYLSWRVVLRVLKGWLRLSYISWRLGGGRIPFQPRGSKLSLWPCIQTAWYTSMRGAGAINNLLSIELFDAALRGLPHQKRGLYLCENQSWERALIHAWRRHGHGELIAVPHGMVRFWDLRYFCDARALVSTTVHPLPQPDLTALNGNAAVGAYRSAGYPEDRIVTCEALRYNYLTELQTVSFDDVDKEGPIKVLVLGDIVGPTTEKALRLLEQASARMSFDTTYALKPHPIYFANPDNYPSLHLKIVTEPLGRIVKNFDVAYASNMTSAAVDAYLAGLPVVVMLDDARLNLSPLRGHPGVRFVGTSAELVRALQCAPHSTAAKPINSFFYLDPDLPRWTRLLESDSCPADLGTESPHDFRRHQPCGEWLEILGK